MKLLSFNLILLLLSALLLYLSLPGQVEVQYLSWISLVPLIFLLRRISLLHAPFYGFVFGFLFYGLNMYWLSGLEKSPLVAWFGSSVFLGIVHFPLLFLAIVVLRKLNSKFLPLNFILLWIIFDFLIREKFLALPILNIAESQYNNANLIQIAEIGGIYLISLLLLLGNCAIYLVILNRKRISALFNFKTNPIDFSLVLVFSILLLSSTVFGIIKLRNYEEGKSFDKTANLLLVQPNFQHRIEGLQSPAKRLSLLDELTRASLSENMRIDLIIWPEVVINDIAFKETQEGFLTSYNDILVRNLLENQKTYGVPLMFGSLISKHYQTNQFGDYFNSMVLLGNNQLPQWYNKQHPLFGAEYIPNYFGPIKKFANESGYGLKAIGEGESLLSLNGVRISTLICSENGLGEVLRRRVLLGANLIVNPTDDSSFSDSTVIHQHSVLNKFRAVENRIYIATVGNTGATGVTAPTGESEILVPLFTKGAIVGGIPYSSNHEKTFFTKHGNYLIKFFAFLLVFEILYIAIVKMLLFKNGSKRRKNSED